MKAEIMGIGTELLMGELNDTNAGWIATRLPPLGITLQWVTLVGDDLEQLTHAIWKGLERSDIIFTTGGLGPTQDDLTREAVAAALGETPAVQESMVEELRQYFRNRGQDMPSHNVKQAWLIPSAQFIPNRNGTAPGWWAERDGKSIVIMPGPPVEMQAIFRDHVEPRLKKLVTEEVTITRNVKTMGLGEASVDEIMSEYFGQENPYLGIYSKADGIHLRVIARAADEPTARRMIEPVELAVKERLGEYIWGYDDETPEQAVAQALQSRGKTLAVMEYCTGGFLANAITEANEAWKHFRGGIVAFGVESMAASGVPPALMDKPRSGQPGGGKRHGFGRAAADGSRLRHRHHRSAGPGRAGRAPHGPGLPGHRSRHKCRPPGDQGTGGAGAASPNHHQAPHLQSGPHRVAQAR